MAAYGGVPVWHASAALIDWDLMRVKPVSEWTAQERKRIDRELERVLHRVGRKSRDDVKVGPTAIHVRRPVSDDEFKITGPAVDVRPKEER